MDGTRKLIQVAVSGLLALTSACTSATHPTDVAPREMSCAETIDNLDQPPSGYRIIADSVAFNPDVLQVTSDPNDPEGRLWSKDGLVVRAGTSFEILATEADAGSLRFAWGTMGGDVSALSVPGCESRGWDWMVFAGGWTVDEPGCYDVLVRADGEIHQTQMAIGTPCDA